MVINYCLGNNGLRECPAFGYSTTSSTKYYCGTLGLLFLSLDFCNSAAKLRARQGGGGIRKRELEREKGERGGGERVTPLYTIISFTCTPASIWVLYIFCFFQRIVFALILRAERSSSTLTLTVLFPGPLACVTAL